MPGTGTASADAPEQQDAARSGRDQGDGAPLPRSPPVNPEMFGSDSDMLPKYPMPTSSLVITPRLRPLAERPKLLRRCALFATGRGSNEVAPTAGARDGPDADPNGPRRNTGIEARNTTRAEPSHTGQPAKSSICLIVHAIDR
jgi:hypothetical protein